MLKEFKLHIMHKDGSSYHEWCTLATAMQVLDSYINNNYKNVEEATIYDAENTALQVVVYGDYEE